jgi:hypothetical protein
VGKQQLEAILKFQAIDSFNFSPPSTIQLGNSVGKVFESGTAKGTFTISVPAFTSILAIPQTNEMSSRFGFLETSGCPFPPLLIKT